MSKLLFDEVPIVASRELAKALGLNESIIVQQIHYWIEKNKKSNINFHNGYYWTYNSIRAWHEEYFDFWSFNTVQRTFTSLEKAGILLSGNFNTDPRDQTKWYTIDYGRLDEKCITPFWGNGLHQIGAMDNPNLGQPLPYTTTYKTTDTTTTPPETPAEKKPELVVVEKEPEIKTSKPSELSPELVKRIKDVTKAEFINPAPFEALIAQPFGELRLKKALDNFKALASTQNLDNPIGFLLYIAKNNITPSKAQSNTKKRFNDFEHHNYTAEDLNRLFEPVT